MPEPISAATAAAYRRRVDVSEETIDAAADEANSLAAKIRDTGDLTPVYQRLDSFVADMDTQKVNIDALLPAGEEPGLGFNIMEKRNGKTLWQYMGHELRTRLCDKNSDDHKALVNAIAGGSTGGLVSLLLTTLGMPVIAIPLISIIAGVILAVGLSGFCDWTSNPPDEPPATR